jgi:hypothetical protein
MRCKKVEFGLLWAYCFILFLIKGGMSIDLLGTRKERVSPISGKPMEPGGNFPLHLGFLHL